MPVDFALDPLTGDLALPIRLETDREMLAARRIRARLQILIGSWFLDLTVGTDWLRVVGQKYRPEVARSLILGEILEDPDVDRAEVDLSFDPAMRRLSVLVRAFAPNGEPLPEITVEIG